MTTSDAEASDATPSDATSSKVRDARVRESKDLIAIRVIELCPAPLIRGCVGGGPVLNAHGLLAPGISRFASIVVDPASIRDLRIALLHRRWRDCPSPQRFRVLPSARMTLTHPDEPAGLILYSVIPGFFADP